MLAEQLRGARSYRRIAGYFTGSLFEIAHEWLEPISVVRIVCNVDLSPKDLKIAQLREARTLGRWNERSIEAESLLNRKRYQRPDAFPAKRGQVIRVAPDVLHAAVHFVTAHPSFDTALDASLAFAGPANDCPVLVDAIGGACCGARAIHIEALAHCRDQPRLDAAAAALAAKDWSPAHV